MFKKTYQCFVIAIVIAFMFIGYTVAIASDYIVTFNISASEVEKVKIINDVGGTLTKDLDIINSKAINMPDNEVANLRKTPGVLRVTADGVIQLEPSIDRRIMGQSPQSVPWGVERIGAKSLGKIVNRQVNVAVLDTGIDLNHPDLQENIAGGINIIDPTKPPMDTDGHGTHIAGVIGAANNDIGILGVAPKASLFAVKVFNEQKFAFYSDIIAGLEWCLKNKIQIINMSFGSYVDDPNIREAVDKVHNSGVIVVASAGNGKSDKPEYPASLPGVFSVSATDDRDRVPQWSNFGSDVDLSAPGVGILSTYLNGGYAMLSGTDMAAAYVTGALAIAVPADINFSKIEESILEKAEDLGDRGRDNFYGYGLVDAKRTAYDTWWQNPTVVIAKAEPTIGFSPLTVDFSAEVKGGPPTKPVFFKWDFKSDGVNDYTNVISAETEHTYTMPGIYKATVEITDFLGKKATDWVIIKVYMPFSVEAIVDPSRGRTTQAFSFSAKINKVNPLTKFKTYEWDFESDGVYDYVSTTSANTTHQYTSTGTYDATLRVTDTFGNAATDKTSVEVAEPISVTLSVDPMEAFETEKFKFTAQASGGSSEPVSYEWNFGDGITDSTSTNEVEHAYSTAGMYTTIVTVTDSWGGDGGTASDSVQVKVKRRFGVALMASKDRVHNTENVVFTAIPENGVPPINYVWDFNDDGIFEQSSGTNPVIGNAFDTSGVHTVTVKATDSIGSATASTQVETAPPVSVTLSADPTRVHTNENISFTAEDSGGFPPIAYEWDFNGDGIFEITSENNVMNHAYSEAKVYTVNVKVTDNIDGLLGTATASIQVDVRPPVSVALFADPMRAHTDDNITFTANASGGFSPITYEWDFNSDGVFDQSTGNINIVNHPFSIPGTHSVTVKATDDIDDTNGTATASTQVEIEPPLTVSLSADKPVVHIYDTITFTATPNGGFTPINYSWDFNNDGVFEQSSGINPTMVHVYPDAGIHTVNVKAVDDIDGPKGTATAPVSVEAKPPLAVDLVANPSSGPLPLNTELTANVQNDIPPVTYTWDLNDDGIFETDSGNVPMVNTTFDQSAGIFKVTVKATDDSGSPRGIATKAVLITVYWEDYVLHTKWGDCEQFNGLGGIAIDEPGYIYAVDGFSIKKFGPQGTFITQWGTQGSGPGQFGQISIVAVDKLGRIFVLDGISTQRFQIFDSIGNYIGLWTPQSINPKPIYSGIAFDSLNNVYLSDGGNDRVFKFDPNGGLLKQWGGHGSGNGQFDTPQEIAINESDIIYILDVNNDRVQKFDSNGNFLAVIGSRGTGAGQFQLPSALAADSMGNIFVTDWIFNSVQKFDQIGNLVTSWGGAGGGDGQFNGPVGIVVDKMGYVYVSDSGNCRIQKFRKGGIVIPPLDVTAEADKQSITIDDEVNFSADSIGAPVKFEWFFNRPPCDNIGVSGNNKTQVEKIEEENIMGFLKGEKVHAENGSVCEADYSSNVSPDTALAPWGGCSFTATIEVTDDYGQTATDTVTITIAFKYTFVKKWGSEGTGDGQFLNGGMWCIVDRRNGWLYITDANNQRVQKFDLNGNFIMKWGSLGSGPNNFRVPVGIAVDSSSDVYVADSNNHRIMKFDSSGQFIRTWGSEGTDDGKFKFPFGVAVDNNDNVYVCESINHRVQKFDSDGNFIKKWGSEGNGDGQFEFPRDLAVDSLNNVYVADGDNNRIQKFDSDGNFIKKWGSSGDKPGQFSWARTIGIDTLDNVYVSDFSNSRIQVFDSDGNYITQWGCFGTGNGQFTAIADVAVDSSGFVFVTDTGFGNVDNDLSVQKFAPPEFVETAPPIQKGFEKPATLTLKPDHNALMQNFPNPFNPETWIPFQLKEDGEITVRIFDAMGRLVRKLDLGYKSAGIYANKDKAVYWDGRNEIGERVSSGVYFYMIETKGFRAIKKMTTMK